MTYATGINALLDLKNGKIAAGSADNKVTIWSVVTGQLLSQLSGHGQPVISLAYISSTLISSGSFGSSGSASIIFWNTTTLTSFGNTITGAFDNTYTIILLPNGYLASGHLDKKIRVWNITSQTELSYSPLSGPNDAVRGMGILPNNYLCTASRDSKIMYWDMDYVPPTTTTPNTTQAPNTTTTTPAYRNLTTVIANNGSYSSLYNEKIYFKLFHMILFFMIYY